MKKIYLYAILATFASMSMLTSCDADAEFETEVPVNPVMRPIISLTAMEQEDIFEGVIDDNKRTIKLEVEAWTDLSNMTVNLNIPKRATLISPSSPEGVWDLTQPVNIVINNIERDVTYTVTAKKKAEFIENPIVSLVAKAGGETATGEIDHTNHTIKLNFGPWVDLSETTLTIEVKPHVKLVDPIALETVCDFSETKTKPIIVNDVQKDVTYNLVVTQTELVSTLVDHTTLKEYKLDNDANIVDSSLGLGTTDFAKLIDGKYMSSPSDYGAVGWSPFACQYNGTADESLKNLSTLTFEARFNIESLNGNDNGNARINTVMGIEKKFLLRVDVHKGGSNDEERFLQLAADDKGSIRYEGSTKIETNKWYDVAVVLDNSKSGSERIALYVNGVRETLQLSNGTPDDLKEINLTSDFYIGQSDGKRRLNGAISYARIWTKALSDQQISEQSGKLLSEDKDGMVANWLFNNGNGNTKTFVSLAGKSFEAEAANIVSSWKTDPILETSTPTE